MKKWSFRTAVAALMAGWALYVEGTASLEATVVASIPALLFLAGWAVKKWRNVVALLLALAVIGCVSTNSHKAVFIESITVEVVPLVGEDMPDARATLVEVHVNPTQTDGTDQTQETKTDAQVEADANVNSPGSTTQ